MSNTALDTTVQARREKVMSLYVRAFKPMQIAAKLGVDPQVVHADIKVIERGWKASPFAVAQYNQWMQRQLEKLDAVEQAAWVAWERSREPMEETSTEVSGPGHDKTKGKEKARITRRESAGDPRFLTQIISVIKQRNGLLGLYQLPRAPIDPSTLTDEQLQRLVDGADPREILGDYSLLPMDAEDDIEVR